MSSATPEPNNAYSDANSVVTRYIYRYHNDSLFTLNVLLLSLIGLLLIMVFFIFIQIGTQPQPLHFKLNTNAQIIDPVPLDQEGISKAALLNWTNEMLMDAFSFNYSNVQKQESKLHQYFSEVAMKIYLDILNTDEDLKNIGNYKFVVSITPKAAPEIIVSKAFQGRYAWQIEIPARITFSNALAKGTQDLIFNFLVWRVPESESDLGIIVATFTRKIVSRMSPQGIRSR
jgi:hypothetical protein